MNRFWSSECGRATASLRSGVLLLASLWLTACPSSKRPDPCGDPSSDVCECASEEDCLPTEAEAEAGDAGDAADARMTADDPEDAGSPGPELDEICDEVTLTAEAIVPNVMLIVDQSLSMEEPFDDEASRWTALKQALVGAGGLIPKFQHRVRFGVALYSGTNGTRQLPPPLGVCPLIRRVDLAEENLGAIQTLYDAAQPLEDAPTGDAIDTVLDGLIASRKVDSLGFQDPTKPTILILATDGEPDSCEALEPQTGQAEAVAAVQRAYSLGVHTFVVAVAGEEELSRGHVRDMANAGVGVVAGEPDAPSFRVQDQAALRQALLDLVSGELSCEVAVPIPPSTNHGGCAILVDLDGEPLECDHPHGWRMGEGEKRLQLLGRACSRFRAGGSLHLQSPCEQLVLR